MESPSLFIAELPLQSVSQGDWSDISWESEEARPVFIATDLYASISFKWVYVGQFKVTPLMRISPRLWQDNTIRNTVRPWPSSVSVYAMC